MRKQIVVIIALALIGIWAPQQAGAQQGGTTRFVYDDNGRLTAVISPGGEAAIYDYDPAGNITAIRRISADTLTLLAFFPHEGGVGDQVTFVGTGFNAGVTSVSFNGSGAQIISVSPSAVVAEVPGPATTGPVTIVTPRGTLITPVPFTIVSRVRVFPSSVTLQPGDATSFTAVGGGGGHQSVAWAVNGIAGGNTSVGTISSIGFYTAPSTLTGNASLNVVIRATSIAHPEMFGEAQVKVLNPNSVGAVFANALSVRKGDALNVAGAVAPMVSVSRGIVVNGTSTALSPPLSVQYGPSVFSSAAVFSPFVSVTTGAVILSISPSSIARGATVTMTITGANLTGASALKFFNSNGALDTSITASGLSVNVDGTQLTAMVTVASGAAAGQRVVAVTADAGTTPAVAAGEHDHDSVGRQTSSLSIDNEQP